MMCTCPNYMIWKGEWTKNDRPKFDFVGHHNYDKLIEISKDFSLFPFIQVPCGKCLECRIQSTRTWSDRCVLEAKNSPYNYFVTLTYDDDHLPPGNSLDPREMQLFIKRLRKHFEGIKVRFLLCGEYGSLSWRPHYHILLFNCPLKDLSYSFYQEVDGKLVRHDRPPSKNNDIYFSQTIYDLWQDYDVDGNPIGHKGMISVGAFNYDTAAYVAQYVTKKCNPDYDSGKIYKEMGLYPEFIRMSNRPGIGAKYFEDHPFVHSNGKLIIPGEGEAHLSSVPRYFDKLFVKRYGQDIFDSEISQKRNMSRLRGVDTYTHSKKCFDKDNEMRDYKLKKIHHLKTSI